MLLIDLNQIMYANMFMNLKTLGHLDENALRYMILNSLRAYNMKFHYGEVILACDSPNSWRRDIFPFYKASRRKARAESLINWKDIFASFAIIKAELAEYFPYTILEIDGAEGDDVIAVMSTLIADKTMILSSDEDFVQLHSGMIGQFNPVHKKKVEKDNIPTFLKEHIIAGDSGDGVPNVCSADDTFVMGKRQNKIGHKMRSYLLETDPTLYPSTEQRNYFRNKELIDLSCIPERITSQIKASYLNKPERHKRKLFDYFYDKKLTKFINSIQEF